MERPTEHETSSTDSDVGKPHALTRAGRAETVRAAFGPAPNAGTARRSRMMERIRFPGKSTKLASEQKKRNLAKALADLAFYEEMARVTLLRLRKLQ